MVDKYVDVTLRLPEGLVASALDTAYVSDKDSTLSERVEHCLIGLIHGDVRI